MTKFRLLCSFVVTWGVVLAWSGAAAAVDEPPCDAMRWQADMDAFEAQDASDPPPQGGIVFVGSSSIRMWDLPKSFPEKAVINRGFGGSEMCDSVHYFDLLVAKHGPRVVVVYAGDNDVANGKSAERVLADFLTFVEKMEAALPESQVVYIAIKPSISRWSLADEMHDANTLIEADCAESEQLTFVDIWKPMLGEDGEPRPELFQEDGLHLNDEGYRLWAGLVRPHLAEEQPQ